MWACVIVAQDLALAEYLVVLIKKKVDVNYLKTMVQQITYVLFLLSIF